MAQLSLVDLASPPVTLSRRIGLGEVAACMASRRISSVVVTDGDHPVGIITERDLLVAMEKGVAHDVPAERIMASPVITAPGDQEVIQAYSLMASRGVRHLVVVDADGQMLGVVSETDFRNHLLRTLVSGDSVVASSMNRLVAVLELGASLGDAVSLLAIHGTSCLVVVDGARPVGVVTERDITRLFAAGEREASIAEVMAEPVITVPQHMPLQEAARRLLDERIRHLVVVDGDDRLVGVLTSRDLMRPHDPSVHRVSIERSRAYLQALIDNAPFIVWMKDTEGRYLAANRRLADVARLDGPSEVVGCTDRDLWPSDLAARYEADDARVLATGERLHLIERFDRGSRPWVETFKSPIRLADGSFLGTVGFAHFITERMEREAQQRLAASVFTHAHDGIMICAPDERILRVNPTCCDITGWSEEELVGHTPRVLASGRQTPEFYRQMWEALAADDFWQGELWNRRKSGAFYVAHMRISAVRDGAGELTHYIGIFSDVTVVRAQEDELRHLAHFDALTRLPNRVLLADRLEQALVRARRTGRRLAVGFLDLDGFKGVNDRFGHAVGDQILIEVADRLTAVCRAGDTVARQGGDEFVLLFGDLSNVSQCHALAQRVLHELARPYTVGDEQVPLSASMGLTLFPDDAADAGRLLRHADQALYEAKVQGRNRHHLFDAGQDVRLQAHAAELRRLGEGLSAGEFELHYHPLVDLVRCEVVALEALVRWRHPERGVLEPAQFLPVFEEPELAERLDLWVATEALGQLARWRRDGMVPDGVRLNINMCAATLRGGDLVPHLEGLFRAHPEVTPADVELEVLETVALEDLSHVAAVLERCRSVGMRVALDDFGTGYSSLSYFRRLATDTVKVDRSFVREMLTQPGDRAIVETVVGLAGAFGCDVVAEGVVDPEAGAALVAMGCHVVQGFGIARPMPAERVPAWLASFGPGSVWGG